MASSAPAQANEATLDLTVNGLRNAKGHVLICVTANPKAFPDCSKDASTRKLKVAAGQAGKVSITGLAPGTYAVALIHDENNNNKMDVFVMPKEGFGFSRNPRIMFGPPKYAEAAIALVAGENRQTIKLNYYL